MGQWYNADAYLERQIEHEYAIDPLLPAGGIGLIHGKGGHGKTQLAFTITKAITEGKPLFGRYLVEQGPVVYVQMDMPDKLFQSRLAKAATDCTNLSELVVGIFEESRNILEPEFQEELANKIYDCQPALVIFDTLRKLHPLEENDNAVPNAVYSAIREVCQGVAALVIHHDRKAPTDGGTSGEDAAESFRGARAWVDDCDLGMRLRKRGNQIIADWSKLRCEEQPQLLLRMNDATLLLEPRDPETAREWVTKLSMEQPDMERSELVKEAAKRAGVSPQAVRKALR